MKKKGVCKNSRVLLSAWCQNTKALGIDSFMIKECALLVQNKGWYETYEMGWAGDWEPEKCLIFIKKKPWWPSELQANHLPIHIRYE